MTEFKKIENELYQATYGEPKIGDANAIFSSIIKNNDILREAIQVEKDKSEERDWVKGLTICDWILWKYKDVNKEIYQELVNLIYTNTDIARITLDGESNKQITYLLMTLWNHNLELTQAQKQFAVKEAKEIHGTKPYDIKYEILRNPNWTTKEKRKLVYDFWKDDEAYKKILDEWELYIINNELNNINTINPPLSREKLCKYSYPYLYVFYRDREIAERMWEKVEFCKDMRTLRPLEKEESFQKIIK